MKKKLIAGREPQRFSPWLKRLLIMKMIVILLLVVGLTSSYAESDAQTTKLNLKLKSGTVKDVIEEIERQTDLSFMYDNNVFNVNRSVSIDVENATVQSLVEKLISGENLKYELVNRYIVITANNTASAFSQQQKSVSGKVTDASGEPLPGVSVVLKGTTNGSITDANGNYSLSNIPENAIVQFSFVGMKGQVVVVGNKTSINVVLEEDAIGVDEVVVVGYGVQRKSDLTGAIASVSSEKLNKTPSTSLGEMLRGAAAGVHVSLSSAAPGGSSTILIRGRRSLSGGNTPLFIVDGVPMSSIDDVNSNDIASLEVLKDASSQSIYGARAANGVILITTKRGLKGKLKISYNTYLASQDIHRNFDFYNGEEWAAYRKEAYTNAHGTYDESDCFRGLMLESLQSGKFIDWENQMISSAMQQKHDLLIQSGSEKTKFALSMGYYDQDGMVPGSEFQRLTGRLNIDHQLLDNLTLGASISYAKSWKQTADGSFNSYITMPPLAQVYNEDGSLKEDVTEAGESHYNPLWNIGYSNNKSQTDRILINLFADWKITNDLSYRANGSMSNRTVHENSYQGLKHTTGKNNNGKAGVSVNFSNDYLFENILNYDRDFNQKHHVDGTLMQSVNVIQWKNIGLNGTGFPNDDLSYNAIGSSTEFGMPTWELSDRRILSYLGRVRYHLLDRYMFTAAIRVDGSSVFGANNKYGYFPSGAFAWRLSEEPFMKNADWLNNLKFRISYGQVGNQGISPYTTLGLTDKYYTEFGSVMKIGYLPGSDLSNPNLKWETSTSGNIGLDYGLFDGKIQGSFELYDTQTTDLLVYRSLSQTSGYSSQLVNLGHVQNRGIEATLSVTPIEKKDFSWTMNLTFYTNENTIKKIDGTLDESGKPKDDVNNKWFIGQPMNVYYDYVFDGIWQTSDDVANSHMPNAKPGSIKIKNVLEDDKITIDDRVIMERDPEWIGTFGTSFKYKNFDLTADLYYSHGGIMHNTYLTTFDTGGDLTGKRNGIKRNYWTADNPSNDAPAPNMMQAPAYINSLGYQDASYIRLRNVSFGYQIPKSIVGKIGADQVRIYSTLTNFWTKTDIQAYGPEQDPGDYPEPRTALIGLNVTF